MNIKMTTNSQLPTTEPRNKNKLSKQLEQEENHRNGDHMERHQWGRRREGGKGTENKQLKWQAENRQGRLRIVWEMEKPKNLYV